MSFLEEELIKVIEKFGGEDAVKVIKALLKLGESTDDVIATESEVKLNDVRKILYKLYDYTLISSTRVRDPSTGWFLFHWSIQLDQLDAFIRNRKRKALENLKQRFKFEQEHEFFECEDCPTQRITFEDAIESTFRCTNCGKQLKTADKKKIIDFLKEKIEQIESELT